MRGFEKAKAFQKTESKIDCHDFANAKSRNDERIEAQDSKTEAKSGARGSDSKILDEKSAFSSDCARSYLSGSDEAQAESTSNGHSSILDEKCGGIIQDSKRQDFGDKNGALRAEAREHTQAYVTEAEAKQSPFLAQNEVSLEKPTPQEVTHTLIIGDNYPALSNLLIRYKNKIKVIYIDPPYGKDDMGQFAETNYHNAITRDNLLSMLYPRLQLARELLKDDGVIFCSIDDRNQAYVKCLFDEVFGEGNFVSCCPVVTNRGGRDYGGIAITHEYILIYQKDMNIDGLNLLADENKKFTFCDENGNFNLMELRNRNIKFNSENRPNLYYPFYVNPNRKDKNDLYEISLVKHKDFIEVYPIQSQGINTVWRWGKEKAKKFLNTDIKAKKKKDGSFMIVQKYRSILKRQKSVFDSVDYITEKGSNAIKDILNAKVFDYPKSTFLIKDLLKIATTSPEVEEDSESERAGAMDCHDSASAESRNDERAESSRQEQRDLDSQAQIEAGVKRGEASQSDSTTFNGKAGRQDFGDKNGALRAEVREHTQVYVTEAEVKQSPFLAQNEVSLEKPTPQDIVLDFFAGSGTTGHAVMELNREDGGKRQFILVTNNEKTKLNPKGIAIDVTSKRLKRIMSGECYDGSRDFKWREKNEPYGGRLEVYEVQAVADIDQNAFEKIDESCYGLKFDSSPKGVQDKIEWVCRNFELTCKECEGDKPQGEGNE